MDASLDLILERLRCAADKGEALRIRGGGSKDFYGEASQGEVLETSGLRGISSYEPSELVITVRAGTPLAEVEAALTECGQCLPFEPPHFGGAPTVGGMVAAGLSGPARASVGSVRDYVLGLTVVNGRAEVLTFGGQVMKNVAGYDVSRLMCGAMGTLGLITEVSLKVLPVAPGEATLRFEMTQADALRKLNEWGGRPLPLNASCWLEDGGVGVLYLRLRGAVAAVNTACAQLGGERVSDSHAPADWRACRDHQLEWFERDAGLDLWRLSVPQTAAVLDLPEPPLVEWHGAQRWVHAPAGLAPAIRDVAVKAGGHATLFRATGGRAGLRRFTPLSAALDRIHRELKRQFDPAGIFNRGRLSPDF